MDNARVCERDLGNNFLLQVRSARRIARASRGRPRGARARVSHPPPLQASQLGQPRCSAVAECLHELNDAVRGSSVEEDPVAIISDKKCDFFRHFTLVIATQLPESTQVELDGMCRELGVTVVFARTYGLLGSVRVSLPEAVALETHPDSTVPDIRVHDPWPELLRLASEVDLEALDDMHHAHVPWALLLVQCGASAISSPPQSRCPSPSSRAPCRPRCHHHEHLAFNMQSRDGRASTAADCLQPGKSRRTSGRWSRPWNGAMK